MFVTALVSLLFFCLVYDSEFVYLICHVFAWGSSFLWVVFTGTWKQGFLLMGELGQRLQFTWLQFLSTWLQRCLSWLEMQAKIWRWRESHQGICSWLLEEMRSLTPWSREPLLEVEWSLTFTSPSSTKPLKIKLFVSGLKWLLTLGPCLVCDPF